VTVDHAVQLAVLWLVTLSAVPSVIWLWRRAPIRLAWRRVSAGIAAVTAAPLVVAAFGWGWLAGPPLVLVGAMLPLLYFVLLAYGEELDERVLTRLYRRNPRFARERPLARFIRGPRQPGGSGRTSGA
jgi:hypothetical protein